MKITLCGSMSFSREMMDIRDKLQFLGHKVSAPQNMEKYVSKEFRTEDKQKKAEVNAIKVHFDKIKNSDAILIINIDKNGVKNYIGENGLIEIAFGHILNKKIFLYNDVPKMGYSDEIESMNPTSIKGDLNKIK